VPTGVTGLARPRRWDATASVELPELAGDPDTELGFVAFSTEIVSPGGPAPDVLERIAAALDPELERPYEVLAVRHGATGWTAAARRLNAELIRLPGVDAEHLQVARPPGGETSFSLDGVPVEGPVAPAVADAFREIESRGRARFQAFAARADNVDGERWQLTIDPL
jgi:hypothetical protein